jgi:3-hydroxypropanoate dehydrogenase
MTDVTHPSPAQKLQRAVSPQTLQTLFTDARTAHAFLPQPVDRALLLRIAELAELGPTSANSLPMRIVFVDTPEGKERLRPVLGPSNVDQTMQAPVTAICAVDTRFYEHLAQTSPKNGPRMIARWGDDPQHSEVAQQFAWDQALLQIGYFTLAVRAVGLDCGAMGGFDRAKTDAEFFPDGRLKAQFLVNIGFGDDSALEARAPRLAGDDLVSFA